MKAPARCGIGMLLLFLSIAQSAAHAHYWVPETPLPTPRSGMCAAVVGSQLFMIGGHESDDVDKVEAFDRHTHTWSARTPMPRPGNYMVSGVINGRIYVAGGYRPGAWAQATAYCYDPKVDVWAGIQSMPIANTGMAGAVFADKLYVFGGDQAMTAAYAYDPQTDQWSVLAPLPRARKLAGAVTLGGRIYVVGGWALLVGTGDPVSATDVYDPATNTWTAGPDLPEALAGVALVVHGGRIWAIGGENARGQSVATVYTYRPGDAGWEVAASLPAPVEIAAAALVGGCIYVAGGVNSTGAVASVYELRSAARTLSVGAATVVDDPNALDLRDAEAAPPAESAASQTAASERATRVWHAGAEATASACAVGSVGDGISIAFGLPHGAATDLKVFDLTGRQISHVPLGYLPAGAHVVTWDGRGEGGGVVPVGMYFCEIRSGDETIRGRITVVR